jgi:hypothetical protein
MFVSGRDGDEERWALVIRAVKTIGPSPIGPRVTARSVQWSKAQSSENLMY